MKNTYLSQINIMGDHGQVRHKWHKPSNIVESSLNSSHNSFTTGKLQDNNPYATVQQI